MDILFVGPNSIKLKGKKSGVLVNPTSNISKTEAEIIILLGEYEDKSFSKIEGHRIVISGQGEYEVNGIKISAIKNNEKLVCLLDLDNVKILVGEGGSIEKVYDKVDNCNIVVVYANDEFDYSVLPKIEPNVILALGAKKEDVGKSLGNDSAEKIIKYSTTAEKLPEDLQVYLLG